MHLSHSKYAIAIYANGYHIGQTDTVYFHYCTGQHSLGHS